MATLFTQVVRVFDEPRSHRHLRMWRAARDRLMQTWVASPATLILSSASGGVQSFGSRRAAGSIVGRMEGRGRCIETSCALCIGLSVLRGL